MVQPPLLDPATGARGSAQTLATRWALPFLRAGRQTLVFGRSRVGVELMLSTLREALRPGDGPRSGFAATGAATCPRSAGRWSAACATGSCSAW
jgi:ATP-dependent helicase YprA (DUF1998 family)